MNSLKPKALHKHEKRDFKKSDAVCHSYFLHFQRDFQQKTVFGHDSGICVIMTKRLRAARCSRSSAVPVPMETGLGYCPPLAGAPSREPFVPDEISSTTFQQQTLQLPPDSFLIEMQINLCG